MFAAAAAAAGELVTSMLETGRPGHLNMIVITVGTLKAPTTPGMTKPQATEHRRSQGAQNQTSPLRTSPFGKLSTLEIGWANHGGLKNLF